MSWRLPEMAIAFVLAGGFAAAGELLLGNGSDSIRAWNESFLAGFGACAVLLFPLSVIAPTGALKILLAFLAASLVVALARRWKGGRRPDARRVEPPATPVDGFSILCLVFIALLIAYFGFLNLRYSFAWDGFQIWSTKAQVLHYEGGLRPLLYPEIDYESRIVTYPNAIPLYEALLCVVRGGFDFGRVKPIFLLFYLSLIVGTHGLARGLLPPRGALLVVVLLLSLPAVSSGHNLGGYVDMPLAAAVASSAGVCLRIQTDPRAARAAPWLIGSLAQYKAEGIPLALMFCVLLIASVALAGAGAIRTNTPRLLMYGAVIGALCLSQMLYTRWTKNPDITYGPIDWAHLSRAASRVPVIAGGCLRRLTDFREWVILWPAFIVAGLVVWVRGSRKEWLLVAGCVLVLATYATIFLFTNWDVALHVENSYHRLAEQVAPLAVVSLAVAWQRLRGRMGEASGTLPDE